MQSNHSTSQPRRNRVAVFIEGTDLEEAAHALGGAIDFRKLREAFSDRGQLLRASYYALTHEGSYLSGRPLLDWLLYNGFTVREKAAPDAPGQRATQSARGALAMELAIDALDLAPYVDTLVFVTGDSRFVPLVDALKQRRRELLIYRLDEAMRMRLRLAGRADERWAMRAAVKPGNLLDIGCGTRCRLGKGLVPFGIEISEALAKRAEPIYSANGGRVVNASANEGLDQFDDEFFRAVIMRSDLEHEAFPKTVIAKIHRKLEPDGIVLVKVPDFGSIGRRIMGAKWCGFRFPDHLNYFTEATLRMLAVKTGFHFKRQNLIPGLNDNLYAMLTRVRSAAKNTIFVAYHGAFEAILA